MANKAFDPVLFRKYDRLGKEVVRRAFATDFNMLLPGQNPYNMDLFSVSDNIGMEVEYAARWTYGNSWPRPLEPAHIPERKRRYIVAALSEGIEVGYAWVRDDAKLVMYVWLSPELWGELCPDRTDTCYMAREDFICVPPEYYRYKSVS